MSRSLRTILNEANANKLPGALQLLRFGDMMGKVVRTRRVAVSSNKITLPENAKADVILACYVTAGTVNGRFTPVYDSTPATTQCSVDATGDIVFLSGDAVTEAEITYVAVEGQVYEEYLTPVTGLASFSNGRKGILCLEAEVITGTVAGVKTVDDRATSPATLHAALNLLGTGVLFNNGTDAPTRVRVKYVATPGFGDAPVSLGVGLDAVDKAL